LGGGTRMARMRHGFSRIVSDAIIRENPCLIRAIRVPLPKLNSEPQPQTHPSPYFFWKNTLT